MLTSSRKITARKRWEEREEFFRFAYKARRHSHVYADAPVYSHQSYDIVPGGPKAPEISATAD